MTNRIKTALLSYYTFKRSAQIACTEIFDGCSIADVLIIAKNDEVIEIEIKISKADMKHELNKGVKHSNWKELENYKYERLEDTFIAKHDQLKHQTDTPNKFYFCVPIELKDFALEFISKLNNKYGLILFNNTKPLLHNLIFIKRAYSLHKENINEKYKRFMIDRLSNDLCSKYRLLYYKNKGKV
jgi:hypothetical protein